MTSDISDELSKIRREFEEMLGEAAEEPGQSDLTVLGFTPSEAQAWRETVEDFPRDIITRRKVIRTIAPETRSIFHGFL